MVKDIAFISYPAKNVAELREFYTSALGLQFNPPFSEDGVEKYAETQVGSGWFAVVTDEWSPVKPGGGLAFEVDDVEKTVGDLKSKGIPTGEIHHTPVCKIGSFTDPEGNTITLHQITVPH